MDKEKFKYKISPKTGSKVTRIATTGILLDFKRGPIVVDPKVLENRNVKNAIDILEKVPIESEPEKETEKKENTTSGSTNSKTRKGGK